MKAPDPLPPPGSTKPADPAPFEEFKALVSKLVKVPKSEADAQEAEYQRQQQKKPKRGPKSG